MDCVEEGCTRRPNETSVYCDPCALRIAGRHDRAEEVEMALDERKEQDRRMLAVRMAVHGEWSALARQLELWGVEPLE